MSTRTLRGVALATALALLLAACSGKATKPHTTPSDLASAFGFAPVAQYQMEATLPDGKHTQQIVLTLGKSLTVTEYKKTHATGCPAVKPDEDIIVPFYTEVVNTSPADATPVRIGVTMALAINPERVNALAVTVEDESLASCSQLWPAKDATQLPMVENTKVTPFEITSPTDPLTLNGDRVTGPSIIMLTSGGNGPLPPLLSSFLRISPLTQGEKARVGYRITKLVANAPAGVISEGDDKGAFYIPLDAKTSPCDEIAKGTTHMKCGTTLAAP